MTESLAIGVALLMNGVPVVSRGGVVTLDVGDQQADYLGFAGGSGITPVLSLIKTTLAVEPKSTFTLVSLSKICALDFPTLKILPPPAPITSISTIGANVQFNPAADASVAAMRADCSMRSRSQEAASATGIGKMVL